MVGMKSCKKCLISEAVPEITLNSLGVCNLCQNYCYDSYAEEEGRKTREADLEKAIKDCRNRGGYDCLVPVSGGKDSIYLLYKLKVEYGLKVLAFTTDINIPPIAWDNITRTLDKILEVDQSRLIDFQFYQGYG